MDASVALGDLLDASTHVVEAVVTGPAGAVEGARTAADERSEALAGAGGTLLAAAGEIRAREPLERVHVDLDGGSLVVLTDGLRSIVATTVPRPTAPLVAHDLRTALSRLRNGHR